MDPTACLESIIRHLEWLEEPDTDTEKPSHRMHRTAVCERLQTLRDWLLKGGFPPDMRGIRLVP